MTPEQHAAAAKDWSVPLRPVIRETMQMSPDKKWSEKSLHNLIREEYSHASIADVRNALLWNQLKGFVDYHFNAQFERDDWFLTERGKALDE